YGTTKLDNPRTIVPSLTVPTGSGLLFAKIVEGPTSGGVRSLFVDYPGFFDRSQLYGTPDGGDYPDNAERFAFFARAVLETAKHGFPPDVLHCHDWQTALVPAFKKTVYQFDEALSRVPVLLTVHNLGYHGFFPPETLTAIGLGWDQFNMHRMEFFGRINY